MFPCPPPPPPCAGLAARELIVLSGSHTVRGASLGAEAEAAVTKTVCRPLVWFPSFPPAAARQCGHLWHHITHDLLAAPSTTPAQLGSKGYGDPVTFDNTYYKTLLDKPWERVSADMAAHIGGWLGSSGLLTGGCLSSSLSLFRLQRARSICVLQVLLVLQASPPTTCCPTTPPAAPSSRSTRQTSSSSSGTLRPLLPR